MGERVTFLYSVNTTLRRWCVTETKCTLNEATGEELIEPRTVKEARDLRTACDAVLARRFPEGSLPQPGTPAPDTPDLPSDPPNGIIIGSVPLRPHRVPVLGAKPAGENASE